MTNLTGASGPGQQVPFHEGWIAVGFWGSKDAVFWIDGGVSLRAYGFCERAIFEP